LQLGATIMREDRSYPVLSGGFLVVLAAALIAVSWAAGTENYPYIHRPVSYRYSLATLDRVYLAALVIFAAHYAAYVAHYLLVGSRQASVPPPPLVFSPTKFVITWVFLAALAGVYALGASIATPALFDAVFGPARETAFLRIWNHTYFGFLLLASLAAGFLYAVLTGMRERGIAGALAWLGDLLSLRSGHRFLGALNLILLLALASNIATGFYILGTAPLLDFPRLAVHAYAMENLARIVHDTGTAFIVASFSGQIYLRLVPGNQWMLKTMFAGYRVKD
jgi:hypothetical protein